MPPKCETSRQSLSFKRLGVRPRSSIRTAPSADPVATRDAMCRHSVAGKRRLTCVPGAYAQAIAFRHSVAASETFSNKKTHKNLGMSALKAFVQASPTLILLPQRFRLRLLPLLFADGRLLVEQHEGPLALPTITSARPSPLMSPATTCAPTPRVAVDEVGDEIDASRRCPCAELEPVQHGLACRGRARPAARATRTVLPVTMSGSSPSKIHQVNCMQLGELDAVLVLLGKPVHEHVLAKHLLCLSPARTRPGQIRARPEASRIA